MGKEAPSSTTTTTQQPVVEGAPWYVKNALDYWNALMSGQGATYPGALTTPQEQQTIGQYGGGLNAMFGDQGMFGQSQAAMQHYLSPEYLDVTADPNWQNAMGMVNQNISSQFSGAGMGYSGLNAEEQNKATAGLLLGEQGRREALQSGLSQFGTEFPLSAAYQFMSMAGLDFTRNYSEWLRQAMQSQEGAQMLGQLGLGAAGRTQTGTTTQTGGEYDWLMDAVKWYMMMNPATLPWVGTAGALGQGQQYLDWAQML